jgi:hypothetical protein
LEFTSEVQSGENKYGNILGQQVIDLKGRNLRIRSIVRDNLPSQFSTIARWSPASGLKVDDTILPMAGFPRHSYPLIHLEISDAFGKSTALQSRDGIVHFMIDTGTINRLKSNYQIEILSFHPHRMGVSR